MRSTRAVTACASPGHKAVCVDAEWRARAADHTHEMDVFEWRPLLAE